MLVLVARADIPVLDLFSLAGKAVIITGGARGLGLCIGTALLEAKCSHVYCCDVLAEPNADEWTHAKQTAKKFGGEISYTQLDITNVDMVNEVFERIYEDATYEVSGVLAAAGIQQMIASIDYPAADFRRVMDVNVAGKTQGACLVNFMG
jgi:NAD(P)-dependent dehydrogenase (short-subunit alcohol dehydrogenase family)